MKSEGTTARRPSRWHRPIWWLNLLAVIALLLAYLSAHVSPARMWVLAFFGIAYPYTLAVNAGFILYWSLFRRKRIWPSLIAILLGWNHVGDYLQFFGDRTAPAADAHRAFKVMSFNVRLFDLYNWSGSLHTRDEIFDLLRLEDADILCLQEFYNADSGSEFVTRDTLLNGFRWIDLHEEYTQHTRLGRHFGIATFSTFPIVDRGSIQFPDDLNNLCLWTDVVVDADTIRIYNAHLASLRFGDQDYRFVQELEPGMKGDALARGGRRIIGLMHNAFIRRAEEVDRIAAHMRSSPHPIVYCGDMNDTPMSYSYMVLNEHLEDAFVESGRGVGHTYIGDIPSFRIDHILHAPVFRSWDFRTLPDELSDHHPITCWLKRTEE